MKKSKKMVFEGFRDGNDIIKWRKSLLKSLGKTFCVRIYDRQPYYSSDVKKVLITIEEV